MNRWRDWQVDVARYGWQGTVLSRLVWRLGKHLGVHIYRVGERPFEAYSKKGVSPLGTRVALLGEEELSRATQDADLDMSLDFVEGAISRKDVAVGAFKGGQLACYIFATTELAPHDENLWVRVKPPYRYTYKGFTLPEYRGEGLSDYVNGLPERNEVFERRECSKAIFLVAASNLPSLKFLSKVHGAKWIGLAVTAKIFRRCVFFYTPRVRDTGFEFVAAPNAAST